MNEWMECKVGDVVYINPDSYLTKDKWEFINYLDTSNLTEGKIEALQTLIPGTDKVPSRAKRKIAVGDVLISTVRPNQKHYGIIKNLNDNTLVSTGFAVLRSRTERIEPYYLYIILTQKDVTEYLSNVAEDSTTAYPSIRPDVIADLDISLPPLSVQKTIASIISSIDDKIDLLHRNNKTLEAMAETIFRQWFVEGSSELQEVVLKELVHVIDNRGKTPPISSHCTDYPIIEVKSIVGEGRLIDYQKIEKYVDQNTFNNWFRAGHPKINDIIISTVGSIGELKMYLENKGTIAQNVVALRTKGFSPYYLFQYLTLPMIKREIREMDIGSVQPSIKIPHLLNLKIRISKDNQLNGQFDHIAKTITEAITTNKIQIRTLESLRDTLLPKLITGEIRVPV